MCLVVYNEVRKWLCEDFYLYVINKVDIFIWKHGLVLSYEADCLLENTVFWSLCKYSYAVNIAICMIEPKLISGNLQQEKGGIQLLRKMIITKKVREHTSNKRVLEMQRWSVCDPMNWSQTRCVSCSLQVVGKSLSGGTIAKENTWIKKVSLEKTCCTKSGFHRKKGLERRALREKWGLWHHHCVRDWQSQPEHRRCYRQNT